MEHIRTQWLVLKARLARSPFRSRFHLKRKEQIYLATHSGQVMEAQIRRFLSERLAPAFPANDGRQTPMRGHPVFVAQHALGMCCRSCLAKWHAIPTGRPLSEKEIQRLTRFILFYFEEEAGDFPEFCETSELFPELQTED